MRLTSRAEHDRTAAYPEVRGLGEVLGSHQAVLDGEIIAPDPGGRPSFALSDGFGAQAIAKLLSRLEALRRDGSPFHTPVPRAAVAGTTWVEPELVGS